MLGIERGSIPTGGTPGLYQVYTWYNSGIYLSYDEVIHIPGIYLSNISREFRYQSRTRLDMVYTGYIPGIYYVQTGTWPVPKRPRNVWVGIYQVYESLRHMSGLSHSYTWYIPGIYFWCIVCTWYILDIWHFCCHISGIYLVYDKYVLVIYLEVGAVEVDMTPCRQCHQQ